MVVHWLSLGIFSEISPWKIGAEYGLDHYTPEVKPSPFKKCWLEDDPFLLGPGNFSGENSLLNFGEVISQPPNDSWDQQENQKLWSS